MRNLTVAVLMLALAGVASAAGWRDMRLDASSEAAFEQSLAALQEKLSPARRLVLSAALLDIWRQGKADAAANEREYTASDYHRQIHGLSYEEVVTFTDPSGATAEARYRDAQRTATAGEPPRWQRPYGASREARTQRAHEALDRAEAMTIRTGEPTP